MEVLLSIDLNSIKIRPSVSMLQIFGYLVFVKIGQVPGKVPATFLYAMRIVKS